MSNGITAHIWCNGDEEKGSEATETNVNTCFVGFKDDEHRSFVRKQLEDCFSQLWEQKAKVLFSDELQPSE
jgi:hypothetical protein